MGRVSLLEAEGEVPSPASGAGIGSRAWAGGATYGAVALLVWVALSQQISRRQFGGDFYQHLSGLAELMRHWWRPSHPYMPTAAREIYFNPFMVVLAGVGKAVGSNPLTLMTVMGVINVALLLWAFGVFAIRVTTSRWAPPVALIIMLLVWGKDPWGWSGHLDISSIAGTATYPSTAAIAAMFGGLAVVARCRALQRATPVAMVLVTLTTAFCLLTHAFTGIWFVLFGACLLLAPTVSWKVRLRLLAAVAIGGLLCLVWPWYPFLDLIKGSGEFDHWQEALVVGFAQHNWPYLLGALLVVPRLRRDRTDALSWMVILAATALAAGWITSKFNWVRVDGVLFAIVAIVASQFAVDWFAAGSWRRAVSGGAIVGLVALSLAWNPPFRQVLTPLPLRSDRSVNRFADFTWASRLQPDSRAMVPYPIFIGFPAFGRGMKQIGSMWPAPFEPSAAARIADWRHFWSASTPAEERSRILDRWNATDLIAGRNDVVVAQFESLGWTETLSHGPWVVLHRP